MSDLLEQYVAIHRKAGLGDHVSGMLANLEDAIDHPHWSQRIRYIRALDLEVFCEKSDEAWKCLSGIGDLRSRESVADLDILQLAIDIGPNSLADRFAIIDRLINESNSPIDRLKYQIVHENQLLLANETSDWAKIIGSAIDDFIAESKDGDTRSLFENVTLGTACQNVQGRHNAFGRAVLERALADESLSPFGKSDVYSQIAKSYVHEESWENAVEHYRLSLALHDAPHVRSELAHVHLACRQPGLAWEVLSDTLGRTDLSEAAVSDLSLALAELALQDNQHISLAVEWLQKASDAPPYFYRQITQYLLSLRQLEDSRSRAEIEAQVKSCLRAASSEKPSVTVNIAAATFSYPTASMQRSQMRKESPLNCDVLILTATDIETESLIKTFVGPTGIPKTVPHSQRSYFDLGVLGGARVFAIQCEAGSGTAGGSLLTVKTAIQETQTKAVIAAGIAFGVAPDKQPIGAILVSTHIKAYEPSRIGSTKGGRVKLTPRGDKVPSSRALLNRFRTCRHTFVDLVSVDFGLLLSGEKLVDNLKFRTSLCKREPEAKGGEMEGVGLYVAAMDEGVDWIVVKSVCDYADGNKGDNKDEYQRKAALSAMRFVFHTIGAGGFGLDHGPPETIEAFIPREDFPIVILEGNATTLNPGRLVCHFFIRNIGDCVVQVSRILWQVQVSRQPFLEHPQDLDVHTGIIERLGRRRFDFFIDEAALPHSPFETIREHLQVTAVVMLHSVPGGIEQRIPFAVAGPLLAD